MIYLVYELAARSHDTHSLSYTNLGCTTHCYKEVCDDSLLRAHELEAMGSELLAGREASCHLDSPVPDVWLP